MPDPLPPLRIVFWTTWFNSLMFEGNDLVLHERDCPKPKGYTIDNEAWCTISPNTEEVESAAAVVFHAADYYHGERPPRTKKQPWILETQESPLTAPFRASEEEMALFDYLASYHLKSSFLFSYYSSSIMDTANRPLPLDFMDTKTAKAPIVWIARNCGASSGRQFYVEELMKYIQVDSYGDCLNNKPFPHDKTRLDLMGEYKFYLAIENANCDDYVTEKLFDTFSVSTVPIVDGPKSYEGLIPTDNSVIRMDNYPDPRKLAAYIDYLDNNDTAYLEYFSFRTQALDVAARNRLDPAFISNWSDPVFHNQRSSWCSICRGMVPWWRSRVQNLSPPKKPENLFKTDVSCTPPGKWNYARDGPPYIPKWLPAEPLEKENGGSTVQQEGVGNWLTVKAEDEDLARKIWFSEVILGALFISIVLYAMSRRRRRQTGNTTGYRPELPAVIA